MNSKSLTGTNTGKAGVNHGDNEAAAATADSVDSIVSPNECGDINLDEGQARVSGKGNDNEKGPEPTLQMKRKANKIPQPGRGRLKLGPERVDHLALWMQVAPYSTRCILGTNRFAGAEGNQGKVIGGILCF